jgi:hypothetical protein
MGDLTYVLKGNRQGFEVRSTDEVRNKPDGYTEIWRGGKMVGLYMTCLLADA